MPTMSSAPITSMTDVVVPLDRRDPSTRAVPVAVRIAERLGLGLRLFCVSDATDEADAYLRDVAQAASTSIPIATAVVPGGDAAPAIVGVAGASGLVCMATSATLRPHQGHIGSVAEDVVRLLGRPLVLVGPEADVRADAVTDRIVAPIDGSELSERTLTVAGDLAGAFAIDAWVVSVVPQRAEAEAGAHVGHVFAAESGYVKHHAEDLGREFGIRVGYDVLHMDDPVRAIVDFAGSDGMIVMSTHGRSGLNRLFGGSVTTGVVARSKRPVVVWRPAHESAPDPAAHPVDG
jgi:nucleotide-binding universal stress UspA family protein